MWWMAAIGVAQGIVQYSQGKKAEKMAGGTAKKNAALVKLETKEKLRRMDRTQSFRLGEAKARMGASNLQLEGSSQQNSLDSIQQEYLTQRDWLAETGARREDIAKKGGQNVGKAEQYAGLIQIGKSIVTPNQEGTGTWWQ
jgi:hypothetical protein